MYQLDEDQKMFTDQVRRMVTEKVAPRAPISIRRASFLGI